MKFNSGLILSPRKGHRPYKLILPINHYAYKLILSINHYVHDRYKIPLFVIRD